MIPRKVEYNEILIYFYFTQIYIIELLRNPKAINKTTSIDHFIKQKQEGELIFQQL